MSTYSTTRRRVLTAAGLGGLVLAGTGVAAARGHNRNFRTHLTGDEEVPEPVDTKAQGQAKFQLSKDGSELRYKLNVANIEDVIGAHIHMAPAGQNGGIVAFLFGEPFVPDSDAVTVNGTLVEGSLGPSDVGDLGALVEAMRNGMTYVNVHTLEYRGGEIRGQIR